LARRSYVELLIAADGKAKRFGAQGTAAPGPPRSKDRPCIHATVFQNEIFGNRKMKRSRRGRIAAARALDRAKAASGGAWRNDP